jgi:hypothetical protein
MTTTKPPDVAEPIMRVLSNYENSPTAPGNTATGDRFVADIQRAKATMNARVAAQSRRENESAWRK